jgi:hypothetical protein
VNYRPSVRPVLATITGITLALTAVGCGGNDEEAEDPVEVDESESSPESMEEETDAAAEGEDESEDESEGESTDEVAEGDADEDATDEATEDETEDSDDEDSDGENSDASAGGGEESQVDIGETWEDPDMEDTIEIVSVVRDFPSEEESELIENGGEVVLVEVSATPGEEYGGAISEGDFEISWDDGQEFWMNKTRMVEAEMEDADRPIFDRVRRMDGEDHTGWIAFLVDERADTYILEYSRSAAEVIGSDETIDEFTEELEIPAP